MANDLWQEVEQAYSNAAGLPQAERTPYLMKNYPERPDIQKEVESLLAQKHAAEELGRSTLFAAAAAMFGDTGGKDDEIIGSIIAGKYLVRERIGGGNMGEVFLADHLTLDMPFALKRPQPALRSDATFRKRLVDEARRAVVLKHENIARVYDIVESGKDMFVVMEYIDGETLRSRLEREGRLPITEFLSIAIQSASALAAAHEKRIVHLDVKPENIMVASNGQVKMCDFGVARKLSSSDASETTTASEGRWTFGGTPAYMAPEVILSYQFDERADQFSLGTMFYEMLTSRNPFLADTVVATTAHIVKDSPAPVRESRPEVDPRLERIVMRLLTKDPEARYPTTTDLVADLEGLRRSEDRARELVQSIRDVYRKTRWMKLAVAFFVLILLVLPVALIYRDLERWLEIRMLPEKKIVAVLPFQVIGDSKGGRFYSDGISEILTGRLGRFTESIRNLQVIPAGEIHSRNVDTPGKAHTEFGANLVLAGTFEVSGDLIRVSYSLIDAVGRRQLRAGSKQVAAADHFTLQDAVIRDVTDMLALELKPQELHGASVFGTKNLQAYFLYTEGRGALRNFQQADNIDQAISLFTQATDEDPHFAAAHAALGQSYWRKFAAKQEKAWLDLAQRACDKAVIEEPELSQAHVCRGLWARSKGDYDLAVEDFRHAVASEPTNDDAQRWLAITLEAQGRLDEAEDAYQGVIKTRPQYWAGYMSLAAFYKDRRHDYRRAIENYSKALDASPDNVPMHYALGAAYEDEGDYDKAISVLKKALELDPSAWPAYSNLGVAYLRSRKYGLAVPLLETAAAKADDYRASGNLARIYWLTGEKAKALNEYRTAIDQGEKLLQVNSKQADVHVLVGRYYAMLHNKDQATSHLTLALNAHPTDPHYLIIAAVSYLQLEDRNNAITYLQEAIAHEARLIDVRAEPELDELQSNSRFKALFPGQGGQN
jgi:tetratricopeptide (TPR) repeat protein/TolB-like protein/predicted Ser/Thr protein kinase